MKDQIETAGIATAFGSKACKTYIPEKDATLVFKLKNAGAVVLGKTTMPDWVGDPEVIFVKPKPMLGVPSYIKPSVPC